VLLPAPASLIRELHPLHKALACQLLLIDSVLSQVLHPEGRAEQQRAVTESAIAFHTRKRSGRCAERVEGRDTYRRSGARFAGVLRT